MWRIHKTEGHNGTAKLQKSIILVKTFSAKYYSRNFFQGQKRTELEESNKKCYQSCVYTSWSIKRALLTWNISNDANISVTLFTNSRIPSNTKDGQNFVIPTFVAFYSRASEDFWKRFSPNKFYIKIAKFIQKLISVFQIIRLYIYFKTALKLEDSWKKNYS